MKEDNREQAFAGIVVEPDHDDTQSNSRAILPRYPDPGLFLFPSYDMPESPYGPQKDTSNESAPAGLHGIGHVAGPANLFTNGGEKEDHKKERKHRPGNKRVRHRPSQQQHKSIGA